MDSILFHNRRRPSASGWIRIGAGILQLVGKGNPSAFFEAVTKEIALVNNLNLMSTVDSVQGAQISQQLAQSRFNFKFTPTYSRGVGDQTAIDQRFGLDMTKLLPFGATVTTSYRNDTGSSQFVNLNNSILTFGMVQPLLRGFGPRATTFDVENAKRARQGAERNLELARQRLAVDVVASYYNIVRREPNLEACFRRAE